jgi:hypothetical protein
MSQMNAQEKGPMPTVEKRESKVRRLFTGKAGIFISAALGVAGMTTLLLRRALSEAFLLVHLEITISTLNAVVLWLFILGLFVSLGVLLSRIWLSAGTVRFATEFPLVLVIVVSGALSLLQWLAMDALSSRVAMTTETELVDHSRHNLVQLYHNISAYAATHGGYLPRPNCWCDALTTSDPGLLEQMFRHPDEPDAACSYAFNAELEGCKLETLAPETVLLFEADGDWNLSGNAQDFNDLTRKRRYSIGIPFADGRIGEYSRVEKLATWRSHGAWFTRGLPFCPQ